jgi:hypothetical protein
VALLFMDGFDHYATSDLAEKWTTNAFCALGSGNGRRGTNGMRQSSYNSWLGLTLPSQPTWIVGCALRITAYPTTGPAGLLEWVEATAIQGRLHIETTGTVSYTRGLTPVGSPSTATIALNTYTYVECLLTVHNTAGVVIVRLNGVEVLTLTGIDTQATATALVDTIRLGNHGANPNFQFGTQDVDDVYVCDGTGAAPHHTFLGDCRIDTLYPSADGAYSAWTPSTGTAHFSLVDEAVPNDDTDFLYTTTASVREAQALGNLPPLTTPRVYGVQQALAARKNSASIGQLVGLLTSGGTTQGGATVHTLTTSYRYCRQVWTTDPATGAAWTVDAVNALEAGVESVPGLATTLALTQHVVEVLSTLAPAVPQPHMQVVA